MSSSRSCIALSPHVRLFSQHVYPVSYIWDADGARRGSVVEYQISLDGGKFQPAVEEGKEIGYLIAVCTQWSTIGPVSSDSILVDLSEVAFRTVPRLERWQISSLFFDTGPRVPGARTWSRRRSSTVPGSAQVHPRPRQCPSGNCARTHSRCARRVRLRQSSGRMATA